jgi:2-C-methyl-D-erythritol 4-phosphate cytidylyltransferase
VRAGLEALSPCSWVVVHDGARPCFDHALLRRGLDAARHTGAAVAGVPVKDTIKVISPDNMVSETPPRDTLWAAQTPQIFRYDLLLEAHRNCHQDVTDDAAMVELLGHPVQMFLGSYENLKVTTPEDLTIMEALLRAAKV